MSEQEYRNRIADLANDDKPREKAMAQGVRSLTSTELIAIVLGSGLPGKSVLDLSREILHSCGDRLDNLARLSIKEMCRKFKGVGPAKAVGLAAAVELGRRSMAAEGLSQMPQITDSASAYNLLRADMAELDHEEFRMIVLNRANRVKGVETISSGGTTGTVVDIKLLLKKAIDSLADGILVAHNHPSGTLRPSPQDDSLTRKIAEGCRAVDIKLFDHIIVTTAGYYSYADQGRL